MGQVWTLVIGNKNYSSWSMRAWLALTQAEIPFEEKLVALDTPTSHTDKLEHAPTARVPVLHAEDTTVWDSLAICEFAAERFPDRAMWPTDPIARARARSICAEMHAGFEHLRRDLPLNCRARHERRDRSAEVDRDIRRVLECWRETRAAFGAGGPFLFGRFSIADAFYAPVASRFFSYDVELDADAHDYQAAVFSLPAMQQWMVDAEHEPWSLPDTDRLS